MVSAEAVQHRWRPAASTPSSTPSSISSRGSAATTPVVGPRTPLIGRFVDWLTEENSDAQQAAEVTVADGDDDDGGGRGEEEKDEEEEASRSSSLDDDLKGGRVLVLGRRPAATAPKEHCTR